MTDFEKELRTWIDQDGLVGNQPNPPKWSTGNAVLETAIAIKLATKHELKDLVAELKQAMANCWYNNALHKNPNRTDAITHDDLLAFAATDRSFADKVCNVGVRNGWNLANVDKDYYTAHAKPWHQSAYLALSNEFECGLWDSLILGVWLILGAFAASYSGIRLMWLVGLSAKFKYDWLFLGLFNVIFKARFKSIKEANSGYYKTSEHILVKYF